MKKRSVFSGKSVVMTLCGGLFAASTLFFHASPAHADQPRATDAPRPAAPAQPPSKLTTKDWLLIAKNL